VCSDKGAKFQIFLDLKKLALEAENGKRDERKSGLVLVGESFLVLHRCSVEYKKLSRFYSVEHLCRNKKLSSKDKPG